MSGFGICFKKNQKRNCIANVCTYLIPAESVRPSTNCSCYHFDASFHVHVALAPYSGYESCHKQSIAWKWDRSIHATNPLRCRPTDIHEIRSLYQSHQRRVTSFSFLCCRPPSGVQPPVTQSFCFVVTRQLPFHSFFLVLHAAESWWLLLSYDVAFAVVWWPQISAFSWFCGYRFRTVDSFVFAFVVFAVASLRTSIQSIVISEESEWNSTVTTVSSMKHQLYANTIEHWNERMKRRKCID